MSDSVFVEYDELAAIDPIGELPLWVIRRAVNETPAHSSWAWEFYRQFEDADAIIDWFGNYLVYNPRTIDDGEHPPIEPGWYYLNEPWVWSPADPGSAQHIVNGGLQALGFGAAGAGADRLRIAGKKVPFLGPAIGLIEFGVDMGNDDIAQEAVDAHFVVRRPSDEAWMQFQAAREAVRRQSLQTMADLARRIDQVASGYERNRALVELQDAINDYTLFYGSDPAAMAAVQPYQQALAQRRIVFSRRRQPRTPMGALPCAGARASFPRHALLSSVQRNSPFDRS